MKFIKNNNSIIIAILCLIFMLFSVVLWNKIILKQSETEESIEIDVSDANNVPSVEAKLGSDMRITQSYLLNYTINKSGIWYKSEAVVQNKTTHDNISILTLSENMKSPNILTATIETSKCDVNIGETVHFVGTVDLHTGNLELSKISKEEIDYKNVTLLTIKELIDNITLVKSNYFIVSGYLQAENGNYMLFDSYEDYREKSDKYFLIHWLDKVPAIDGQVKIKCKLEDTKKLEECEINN